MKIGLFFGSFNPIHIGHLIIAQSILDMSAMEEVWFVISPQNPFKKSSNLIHEFDRIKMVELAIEGNFKFRASDVEFRMPKPSFTIDTLTYLSEKFPGRNFYVIMGGDNAINFQKWKNADLILENYNLIIYPRPGQNDFGTLTEHPSVQWIEAPLLDISATYIRKCIALGKSIQYLVPDSVADFIKNKKLYLD
ncbi:MAG: nicotinate-nucleotide adenylyltransferase [Cyclobacteriaceae bacterium]|nr:nicotinate-nucleotide adenylyltransferase [Cyclobacteriaceae bacterium]